MLGHKTQRCTNTATFSQERFRANSASGHNVFEQTFVQCATCVHFDGS